MVSIIKENHHKKTMTTKIKFFDFNFFKMILILTSFINILSFNVYKISKILSHLNQITLKIRGSGQINIFDSYLIPYLSKIKVNEYDVTVSNSIYLTSYHNTIKLIFDSKVSNCNNMFQYCNMINEIDLSEFDSSVVSKMDYMFDGCTSLTSINFNNFQTSQVTYMRYVFQNCESLESLDLSGFNTYYIEDFHYMFYNCKSLKYVDLSSFRTTSNECLHNMFNGCESLTSLDLSNFDTSKVYLINNMFYGCKKLEYVNLKNSVLYSSELSTYNDFITNAAKNMVLCVKQESINIYRNDLLPNNPCAVLISDCDSNWRKKQKKIVPDSDTCVESCTSTENYKYEYLGKCYNKCPERTTNIEYECYECHSDCKECESNNPSLCISCSDSNKFLKNGNCISTCSDGYYLSPYDSSIKICECNLIQCSECTIDSREKQLCTSCNAGYYPIYNDPKNDGDFFDCYQNKEGYFLSNNYLYNCYSTCKSCNTGGNSQYHNCIECSSEYEFSITLNEYKNCYKCDYYYYIDNNNQFSCTNSLDCPNEYNKLILDKKECINECKNDNKYRYEFRKRCYENCPSGTKENNDKLFYCEIICTKLIPFEKIPTQECISFCGINDWYNGLCKSNYEDEDTNAEIILNNILSDLNHNKYNNILINTENDIIIREKWATFTLTTTKSINREISDIIKCENILKNKYNITIDEYLTILVINISKVDMIKPKIEYEVYFPLNKENFSRLDLNFCSNEIFKITNCSQYSLKSIIYDLCISCREGFYPIYNDPLNINSFIKCYQNPEGYYLDLNIWKYKSCYFSCKICDKEGDINFHNCLICNSKYPNELHYPNYINCYDTCPFYHYYSIDDNKIYCTSNLSCSEYEYNKIILEKNECIKNCSQDDLYKYEFKKRCYDTCPNNTVESENREYYCNVKCPQGTIFEVISTQDCKDFCGIDDMISEKCAVNKYIEGKTDSEIDEEILKSIRYCINNGYNISKTENGHDLYIDGKISFFTLTNTINQKNIILPDKTSINLEKCENELKVHYNIPLNVSLFILKLDISQNESKIPKIFYEIYYPINGTNLKLNLSLCKNNQIDLFYPVSIDNNDIDKYNISSGYYNDICYTSTSEKGTDISLSDRKEYFINNNLSICEEGCILEKYDKENNRSKCTCDIILEIPFISNIKINKAKIRDSFSDINNILNIKIIKCYKLLLDINKLKKNFGIFIFISIIFLFFIFVILFYSFDYKNLKNKIEILVNTKINWKEIKINNAINNVNELMKQEMKKTKTPIILIELENRNHRAKKNENRNLTRKKIDKLIKSTQRKLKKNSKINKSKIYIMQKNFKSKISSNLTTIVPNKNFDYYENIMKPNDNELNSLKYKEALNLDKRNYCKYYISLLKTKHLVFFSFFNFNDYNSIVIKIFLFFFIVFINFSVNTLFFTDYIFHIIYENEGIFDFIYRIPQIIGSSLISVILTSLFRSLSLSEYNILLLKKEKDSKIIKTKKEKTLKIISIKLIIFFILCFLIIILLGYYISCFCAVYINTQIYLIKNFGISFGISLLYQIIFYLIPGIFRVFSLQSKKKNREYIFLLSKLLQII